MNHLRTDSLPSTAVHPPPERAASAARTTLSEGLAQFLTYVRVECGLADNSVQAYQRDLTGLIAFVVGQGGQYVDALTALAVQQFLRNLHQRGLALATVTRHLASIRVFLRFCENNDWLDDEVAGRLETPARWQRLPDTMSSRDVEALLRAPDPDETLYLRDRAILELLYATGVRVSELCDLRMEGLNYEIGYVRCVGKGCRERIVPVGRTALEAVREYVLLLRPKLTTQRDGGYLFLSRTGRRLGRENCWRLVGKYANRAGLAAHVSPHTLRHSFATHMMEGGAGLRIVQELLGHADVTTTQVYTHVDRKRLKSIHTRFHPRQ